MWWYYWWPWLWWGRGRGWCRWFFTLYMLGYWYPPWSPFWPIPYSEREYLERERDYLKRELEYIERRLRELEAR
ncbi:MAG: DUF5320 domain-containing protein [Candidatus Korarchaeota archaeon]|nr:DUF5320 domain-containing protein [Candidatus Korarchaeota archaeon]